MTQALKDEIALGFSPRCCDRCGKSITSKWGFEFRAKSQQTLADAEGPDESVTKCLSCALKHRPMLRRSMMASLVVGTVLTILNQGDLLLSGQWNSALLWKIPLTFCVPFLVATYGALTNSRK